MDIYASLVIKSQCKYANLGRRDEFKHFADDLRISQDVNALENNIIHLPYFFHCCFRNSPCENLILHMYVKQKDADQLHGDHA